VEFSGKIKRVEKSVEENSNETQEIHRATDHQNLERSRSRCAGSRAQSPIWRQSKFFFKWKAKYGGLDVSPLKGLRELEEENRKLKQMYTELSLDHKLLKEIVEKKL